MPASRCFISPESASYAARMSANIVPPFDDGTSLACRIASRGGSSSYGESVCQSVARFTPNQSAIKLLSVLVRNHARNRRRRHEIARPHDSGDETLALVTAEALPVDELMAQAQEFALMIGCLDHLGGLQRAAVSLRMLDGVAGEDVAAMLGLPPSHVAVLLHRAKQNLKSCMVSAG
jgi:RNA polymerase sigma factor (sigma-70 family)